MTPLLACPDCSSPRAKMFARPMAYRGVRSGRWMILAAGGCDHVDVRESWNSGDEPEPLIAIWNERATKAAADRSARLQHTPEQAADFLAALQEPRYRQ